MDFKLVDKKNMGVVSLLLLVIILSQARFFNFLIDTALGRAFLIAFIIFISCCHKIMGVVGVLLIIIMFKRSQIGILEGFDVDAAIQSKMDACGNDTSTQLPNLASIQNKIAQVQAQSSTDACGNDISSTTPTTSTTTSTTTTTPASPTPNLSTLQSKAQATKATEGFDIIGTESRLKSGKQSNSISVNHKTRNSESVLPFEENIFSTSNYSKF